MDWSFGTAGSSTRSLLRREATLSLHGSDGPVSRGPTLDSLTGQMRRRTPREARLENLSRCGLEKEENGKTTTASNPRVETDGGVRWHPWIKVVRVLVAPPNSLLEMEEDGNGRSFSVGARLDYIRNVCVRNGRSQAAWETQDPHRMGLVRDNGP